jgi:prepilin-type N-terminal cleavage/methylation domain-containing protein
MKSNPDRTLAEHGSGKLRSRRHAFSLIELLVVVAVIAALMMITLKTAKYVNQKTARTRVMKQIEQIRNVLASYYSEFGCYPPGSAGPVTYEYYNKTFSPAGVPNKPQYKTGLVYYIWWGGASNSGPDMGSPTIDPNHNTAGIIKRWQNQLVDLIYTGITPPKTGSSGMGGGENWCNSFSTIRDPWNRDYRYECLPPYQHYKIWSMGGNGVDDNGVDDNKTKDDIGIGWFE